ncbi:MAG: fructosamine kinase family protein [Myxococcota bacterium]
MMNEQLRKAVSSALRDELGKDLHVEEVRAVGGGSINRAAVIETGEGEFFLKWNTHPIDDQFELEAMALEEMRDSNTELVIPRPIVHRSPEGRAPGFLVIEYLEPGQRVADFDEQLGRGLAALHRKTADAFGFHRDNYCGTTPQPNPWRSDWVEFYRDERLGFQLELAVDKRGVSSSQRRAYEKLLGRLDEFLATEESVPSLIHGDLWSGNLHVAPDGRPSLIDPAAYFGHREAELGMMRLFGGFSDRVYDAYHDAWPLEQGWRERLELYELYHLMNHFNLFGGGYGRRAFSIVEHWV